MKLKNAILALKKGFRTKNLPEHVINFNNILYVRVFRFLGQLSILLSLLSINKEYHSLFSLPLMIILVIFNLMYFIYYIWLNYHRVKHMRKVLKSGDLDIKN